MPIYEYKCKTCDQIFEQLIIGSDQPFCPSCDSKDVVRLMSACGFVSRNGAGQTVSTAASGSSCSGCSASSCAGCSS